MTKEQLIQAIEKSAKELGWGVLPAGDYPGGLRDPGFLSDGGLALREAGAGRFVITDQLTELINQVIQGLREKSLPERMGMEDDFRRLIWNLDLDTKATNTLNLVVAGVGVAGGGAAAALPKTKKGR